MKNDILDELRFIAEGYVELYLNNIDFAEERWADFIGMENANFRGGAIKFERGYSAHSLVYEQQCEIAAKLTGVEFKEVELRIPITHIPASFVDGGLESGEEVFLDVANAKLILEPENFAYGELGCAVEEIERLRAERTEVMAENAKLREALKPFANEAKAWVDVGDESQTLFDSDLTIQDIRRAAALLETSDSGMIVP